MTLPEGRSAIALLQRQVDRPRQRHGSAFGPGGTRRRHRSRPRAGEQEERRLLVVSERLFAVPLREERTCPWSAWAPIQPGDSRAPLFLVHGIGGNLLGYRALAAHLGPDQPVYGLQAQGLDGQPVARTSLEAMAVQYLREVRSVQPEGPYLLGGFPFGGTAASEMAQQLHAVGQPGALLALLDTKAPGRRRPHPS